MSNYYQANNDQFNSPAGAGGYYENASPAYGSERKAGGPGSGPLRTIRPVTIKQLTELAKSPTPESNLVLDGQELSSVTFVGCVRKVSQKALYTTFLIEDGTGKTEIRYFHASASSSQDPSENVVDEFGKSSIVSENTYVKLLCRANGSSGNKSFVAQNIHEITDFNEVTCHFLEAMMATLHFTKGKAVSSNLGAASMASNQNPDQAASNNVSDSLNDVQRRFLQLVKEMQVGENGSYVPDIIARMTKEGFNQAKIQDAAEFLRTEGQVFSTIDENHLQPSIA